MPNGGDREAIECAMKKIQKCLFIINSLMNGGKSLDEINESWFHSEHFDNTITPRSFYRYKNEIANLFNIDIEYNNSSKIYELQDIENIRKNKLFSYLLTSFQVQTSAQLFIKHKQRIILPPPPKGSEFIQQILEAFNKQVFIIYRKKKSPSINYEAIPYILKIWEDRWYLIMQIRNEKDSTIICLSDINSIEISQEPCIINEQILHLIT